MVMFMFLSIQLPKELPLFIRGLVITRFFGEGLGGGGVGVIETTTYLMNITDKILFNLALKFELTQFKILS